VMIDWTKLTDDPVDNNVRSKVLQYLKSIRQELPFNNYDLYLAQEYKDKRVLDIGIVEHTRERMHADSWKHKIALNNARYVLGLDINHELVNELKSDGLNVVCCDATSDNYLGEKFDIIHIGDVIEHVNSPVDLIKFAVKHLDENGKIIVRTPAAYHYNYVNLVKRQSTDLSNMEHMFYVLPIHMMEICRRSEIGLSSYLTLTRGGFTIRGVKKMLRALSQFKFKHCFAEIHTPPEMYTTIYVYELQINKQKEGV